MWTATRRQIRRVAESGESMDGEGDAVFRIGTTALVQRPSNDNILPKFRIILTTQGPVFGSGGCTSAVCDTITILGIQPRCARAVGMRPLNNRMGTHISLNTLTCTSAVKG
jgi:hypothetical protein